MRCDTNQLKFRKCPYLFFKQRLKARMSSRPIRHSLEIQWTKRDGRDCCNLPSGWNQGEDGMVLKIERHLGMKNKNKGSRGNSKQVMKGQTTEPMLVNPGATINWVKLLVPEVETKMTLLDSGAFADLTFPSKTSLVSLTCCPLPSYWLTCIILARIAPAGALRVC